MNNLKSLRTGRRVSKNWTIPLPMVELIEYRAVTDQNSEGKVVEELIFKGLQAEQQATMRLETSAGLNSGTEAQQNVESGSLAGDR